MQAPAAVTVVNESGRTPLLLLCEHASSFIPPRFANLGLPESELRRHIAYDIGAAEVARHLSRLLDAPLALTGYSRLLIDCNRPPEAPSLIPLRSEATEIPGNRNLTAAARAERDRLFFAPFRARVAELIAARQPRLLIGMHSFTPVFLGVPRPWQVGVLWHRARTLAASLLAALRENAALLVGDNEPYRVTVEGDYTVPHVGEARGIPTALFEVRQDLIGDPVGAAAWGERLAGVLARVLADPAGIGGLD